MNRPLDPGNMRLIVEVAESPEAALMAVLQARGDEFDIETAGSLFGTLASIVTDLETEILPPVKALATPLADYICARLAMRTNNYSDAFDHLNRLIKTVGKTPPEISAMRAQLNMQSGGSLVSTISDLRSALKARPDHLFYARYDKFITRLLNADWVPRRNVKLAILGSSTLSFLAQAVRFIGFREGLAVEVYTSNFGAWRQDVLNKLSGLHEFNPDVVVVLPNALELALTPCVKQHEVTDLLDEMLAIRQQLAEGLAAHIIQFGIEMPTSGAWGGLEDQLPDGRRRMVSRINDGLSADLPGSMSYIDPLRVRMFADQITDFEQWCRAKLYPCQEATPGFAELIISHVRAVCGLSAKALVVDLDNTLWGGVIGEDGLSGILLGPPNPTGEAYLALQRYIRDLGQKGILLAVCSKNNLADAELAFAEHDAMVLKKEDFLAFSSNWQDKATNISSIAEELNIGTDAIVFLDDSPVERAWVRNQLPEVHVLENDATPAGMLKALDESLLFESVGLTSEDQTRHVSYRANAAIREAGSEYQTMDDFLASLSMRCDHGPVDSLRLARVAQLVNKTNQFNLTGRRYNESQILKAIDSGQWWWHWFSLVDRFGDHGLIGVIAARCEDDTWNLDNWLMSCRVLGRRMENFMARTLFIAARESGATELTATFVPSDQNEMVSGLLPRMGFIEAGTTGDHLHYRQHPGYALVETGGPILDIQAMDAA
tara:strand:+ start:1533 stop:3683 length:2151 start_codon:yes stop_codon:yes gene_type:complete